MARIEVGTVIDAPPGEVWAAIEDLSTHVAWMADAVAIRFLTEQTSGVGTRFECDTRVGPLKVTDVLEITDWRPAEAMGVRHTGVVTGEGHFTLSPEGAGTSFAWVEELHFPWWMAGALGAAIGAPVLKRIWAGNLRRLKARIEGEP